jgi:hypothetical protein
MVIALDRKLDRLPAWRLSDAELRDRYLASEREIIRLQAQAAADLAELDSRRAFQPEHLDCTSFVRAALGVSGSEAARRVHEARGMRDHPAVAEAFSAGRIDRPRVRMLVAAAEVSAETFARDEAVLVDQVGTLPMRDAVRLLEYWRQAADRASVAREAEHLHHRRRLHLSHTFGGMVRLDGELDPEGGEIVMTAIASLVDPANLAPDDTRNQAQRRADALVELCADHLNHGDTPVTGGRRPHLTILAAAQVLDGEPGDPCELDSGAIVSPETVRRIACDATVIRLRGDGDTILDVGRATRSIPSAIRSALIARDRGCTHPGCDRPYRWCDAHHIIHWADGGPTSVGNLRLLCRRHHRMVHEESARRRE